MVKLVSNELDECPDLCRLKVARWVHHLNRKGRWAELTQHCANFASMKLLTKKPVGRDSNAYAGEDCFAQYLRVIGGKIAIDSDFLCLTPPLKDP
jgi:hypothetical protein